MDPARRAFYEFHSSFMEPWDGPACVAFTDGTQIGAVLDRNGLRPGRYWVTDDGLVVLASEVGVLDLDPTTDRPQGPPRSPAGCSSSTLDEHRIVEDDEIKDDARRRSTPTTSGCTPGLDPPRRPARPRAHRAHARLGHPAPAGVRLHRGGAADPARADGQAPAPRPIGSMGTDTPDRGAVATGRGCCSTTSASCSPRSPTRRSTRSARSSSPRWPARIGPEGNLLDADARRRAARSCLPFPVHRQRRARQDPPHQPRRRPARLRRPTSSAASTTSTAAATALRDAARRDLRRGVDGDRRRRPHHRALRPRTPTATSRRSRRCCSPPRCTTTWSARRPAPRSAWSSRPATSARCTTSRCSSATARPRSTPTSRWRRSRTSPASGASSRASTPEQAVRNLVKALGKGVAQGDEQDGHLDRRVVHRRADLRGRRPVARSSSTRYFTGTTSQLGGVGLDVIAEEVARAAPQGLPARRHRRARTASSRSAASTSGAARASRTCSTPRRCSGCSTRPARGSYDIFKQYTPRVDEQSERLMTLRGLFGFSDGVPPAGADRRGRAGQRDRQAVQHRRDVATARSARRRTRPSPSR